MKKFSLPGAPRNRTLGFIFVVYVLLVVVFQISFLHKDEHGDFVSLSKATTPVTRRPWNTKRMQEIIQAEERAEIAVLKGQDSPNPFPPLFSNPAARSLNSQSNSIFHPKGRGITGSGSTVSGGPESNSTSGQQKPDVPSEALFLADLIPDPSFKASGKEPLPLSRIVCKRGSANCVVTNLYYWNGRMHVFIPGGEKGKMITINTGIGFGTPSATIYVHTREPPPHFTQAKKITETSSIYSVMWENLMRTFYGGSGALYTLMEHNLYSKNHRIFLHERERLKDFTFLLDGVTNYPFQFLSDMNNTLFTKAVVGISRHFRIKEIESEFVDPLDLRKKAFLEFSESVRSTVIKKSSYGKSFDEKALLEKFADLNRDLIITFIRRNGTRVIENFDELVKRVEALPGVVVQTYYFELLSFPEQVRVVFETDVLIGMHGAAMAHVFFMRPDATLLEMFPYGFRKIVYQNLARLVNVNYFAWQNHYRDRTKFNWNYVETHKLSNWTKEEILTRPLDWYNMDSKNYWRQQDTVADVPSFMAAISSIINKRTTKYLLYTPSQNSSRVAIQAALACSLGKALNRKVVVSPVGWLQEARQESTVGPEATPTASPPMELVWSGLEEHYDQANQLPCDFITMSNFNSLFSILKVPLVLHSVKDSPVLRSAFNNSVHVSVDTVRTVSPLPFDTAAFVSAFKDSGQFLAFGNLDASFFGLKDSSTHLLSTLPNFLPAIEVVTTLPPVLTSFVRADYSKFGASSIAVHLSPHSQMERIKGKLSGLIASSRPETVFVATSIALEDPQVEKFTTWLLSMGVTPLLFKDVIDALHPRPLDKFEIEQLERRILTNAREFLGAPESDYSQLVAFAREKAGKQTVWIS